MILANYVSRDISDVSVISSDYNIKLIETPGINLHYENLSIPNEKYSNSLDIMTIITSIMNCHRTNLFKLYSDNGPLFFQDRIICCLSGTERNLDNVLSNIKLVKHKTNTLYLYADKINKNLGFLPMIDLIWVADPVTLIKIFRTEFIIRDYLDWAKLSKPEILDYTPRKITAEIFDLIEINCAKSNINLFESDISYV